MLHGGFTKAASDSVEFFEAGTVQKHAAFAGGVAGRHAMGTHFKARCFPRCTAIRVELDRPSYLGAVKGELDGSGRTVFTI